MLNGIVGQIKDAVGDTGVLTNEFDMAPYLRDWRGRKTGKAQCVVFPQSTAQVAQVVRIAGEAGQAVFPQGGNTGLCYGAVPVGADNGIVIALHRMSRIRHLDKADNAITVDAGVVLSTIHHAAERIGRTFPLHLGSEGTAQIGGLISTNAGGPNALRYGMTRELVYGLEVVLSNGEIIQDLSPLRKNNAGYDLKHLFIGAEGTLGIITGASLRLHPAIRSEAHAWVAVPKLTAALALLQALQERFDTAILACELLSRSQVDLVLKHIPRARTPFAATPDWSVLIQLGSADAEEDLKAKLETFLMGIIESSTAKDAIVAESLSQSAAFWHVRHSVSEANKLEGHGLTHDVSVKVSRIPQFIEDCEALLRDRFPGSYSVVTCHLGDGNVHYIAMFPRENWQELNTPSDTEEDVQQAIHDIAMKHGGSFSAEHGIGRKLTGEMKRLTSRNRYDIMRKFKEIFDAKTTLNPGVIFGETERTAKL
jgi:FAD/FMN-containing dehydrogenase